MSDIFLPLRLYSSEDEVAINKPECEGYRHVEFFCSPTDYLPPFQYTGVLNDVYLVDCEGVETAISPPIQTDTVTFSEGVITNPEPPLYAIPLADEVVYRTHWGSAISPISGLYQIRIGTRYSDPIYFTDTEDMIEISFRNGDMLGSMFFPAGFYGSIHLNTFIDKPQYQIMEEVREDGAGNQHLVFQRYEKRYSIRMKGVESMADAMSILRLMDEVYINGERVYDLQVDVSWEEEYDCLCSIEISYQKNKILKHY